MTQKQQELVEIAKRIKGYQDQKRWSDNATCKNLPLIGSSKTYKKIQNGDLSELDIERQHANYLATWESIKSATGDADPDEPLFEEVYATAKLLEDFTEIMESTSLARMIMVQGPTSSGKSGAKRVLMRTFPNRIFAIEANEGWNDNPLYLCKTALKAMGISNPPQGLFDCQEMLIDMLCAKRWGMVIDEAHHMGPRCLNTIKTIINRTPGEVILFAMGTLWERLERGLKSYEEARQLIHNRLFSRIVIDQSLRLADAIVVLKNRLGISQELAEQAAHQILPESYANGRMAFVRNICNEVAGSVNGHSIDFNMIDKARKIVVARKSSAPRAVK